MMSRVLLLLAVVLAVLQAAAAIQVPLVFKATPTDFKQNIAANLTLNCTVDYDPQQPLKLIGLALYKSGSGQPLVSIDYFKGNTPILGPAIPGRNKQNAHGFINSRKMSFLHIVMDGINQTAVGNYRCEGQFMDQNANIIKETSTLSVTGTVDTSTNTNPNSKNPSTNNAGDLHLYTQNLAKLVGGLMQLESHLFYTPSALFNGHKYHLSRIPFFDIDLAHQICKLVLNGYLVQIDDLKEHDKIKEYLKEQASNIVNHNVLVGTKEDQAGKMVQVNDDTKEATDLGGLIAAGPAKCVELENGNWNPKRVECIGDSARFLCEVQ